ncbi:hypothetical protein IIC65_09265, partial [Candidatus Sumerlaeota bacterium]|nr:hypothetical protein [Candidatus Sumerlaeota bacterium]
GAYLVQLVSSDDPRQIPLDEVQEEIIERLSHEHVRSHYGFLLQQCSKDIFVNNLAALWDYADLGTPIALLGETVLTRDDLIRINPAVINAYYEVQWDPILGGTARWIEGEIVLRDLEERSLDRHPLMERARRVRDTYLAAREELSGRVAPDSVSTLEAALETLGKGGGPGSPGDARIPQSRVIEISLIPEEAALLELGRLEILRQTIRQLSATIASGHLPTRPDPAEFAHALALAAADGEGELGAAINAMAGRLDSSPWIDVRVRLDDHGWRDSLPGIAWHPTLIGLKQGEISAPQRRGAYVSYYYVAQSRMTESSAWLEVPMALQTAAFEVEKLRLLDDEIAKIQSMDLLRFSVEQ